MVEVISSSISAHQLMVVDSEKNGSRRKLIYMLLPEPDCRYSVNAIDICDTNMCALKEPILKVGKDMLPFGSSVAAVKSHIFMVGGQIVHGPKERETCPKVLAFDTVSSTLYEGPPLSSGKCLPVLFVSGSKLFALSNQVHDIYDNPELDPKPRFEVLDTQKLCPDNPNAAAWRSLPDPDFPPIDYRSYMYRDYTVSSHLVSAYGDFIFISMPTPGTYAFDVAKECWTHVSKEDLFPFKGEAKAMPLKDNPNDSLLYALCRGRICAFRLHYDVSSSTTPNLLVDPIRVVSIPPFSPVPIPKIYQPCRLLVPLDGDRLCLILTGLDKTTMSYNFDLESTCRHIVLNFFSADKSDCNMNDPEERQHKRMKVDPEKKKQNGIPRSLKRRIQSCQGELDGCGQEEIRLAKWERRCLFAGPMGDHLCHVSAAYYM